MDHIESSRARDDIKARYRSGSGPCFDSWFVHVSFKVQGMVGDAGILLRYGRKMESLSCCSAMGLLLSPLCWRSLLDVRTEE